MLTIIARLKVKEGQEEAGMALIRETVKAVQADEPGCMAYISHQSKDNPGEIVYFEIYNEEADLQAHRKTAHMLNMRAKFQDHFEGPVKIETLERIGGFVR